MELHAGSACSLRGHATHSRILIGVRETCGTAGRPQLSQSPVGSGVDTVRCLARASLSAVPPTSVSPAVAGAGQANTRKVYGRILRRVAAEFGEDIAPDAASAWG